jgi:toxin ParE1/3/4
MKIHKVVLTDTANECLFNIAKYIALDSPTRAETFIEELVESLFKTLSVFPLAGKVYEDIEADVEIRSLPYQKYVSFYRVKNDSVEILFILNSAQNIKAILNAMNLEG